MHFQLSLQYDECFTTHECTCTGYSWRTEEGLVNSAWNGAGEVAWRMYI